MFETIEQKIMGKIKILKSQSFFYSTKHLNSSEIGLVLIMGKNSPVGFVPFVAMQKIQANENQIFASGLKR